MLNKKIIVQTIACLVVFTVVQMGFVDRIPKAEVLIDTASKNYSIKDLLTAAKNITEHMADLPASVTTAILDANNLNLYGEPLEVAEKGIKHVYAARGGDVEKSGSDSQIGLYVVINHGDSCTIYGNLNKINVVQGERIKKGDIIASYDESCGKEFYYAVK